MRTESVACGQNSTRVLFSQRRPVGRTCSRLLRPCARPSIRAPQSSGATRGERYVWIHTFGDLCVTPSALTGEGWCEGEASSRRSRDDGNPSRSPPPWIPACAGMTIVQRPPFAGMPEGDGGCSGCVAHIF